MRATRASRVPTATHRTPLYAPPAGLRSGQPWFSRQEIDTLPAAQAALQGRAVAWLADRGFDPVFGARPVKRVIQREVQDRAADVILSGEARPDSVFVLDVAGDGLAMKRVASTETANAR